MTLPQADLQFALDLVLQYGWNATSYQIINPGIRHWFPAQHDAVAGYVQHYGVRVVAGAPVCPTDRLADVVAEFESSVGTKTVCYFGAEQDGSAVAFCIASPVPLRGGWLVEQLVRGRGAPNGTA